MAIETIDDIVEDMADKLGIHGGCTDPIGDDGCEGDVGHGHCCRISFVSELRDRIDRAIEVEQKLGTIKKS